MPLGDVLADLGDDEPIRRCVWRRDRIWLGECRASWPEAALWLSRTHGGMWIPSQHGLTWLLGRSVCRLMTPAYYDLVEDCRGVCLSVSAPPGDSVGGCARSLLGLMGEPQYPYKGLLTLHGGRYCGYHDCTPGRWEWGTQYDVSGCYYHLLRRLPSVRCHLGREGLVWHAWQRGEEETWRLILDACGPLKPLRNTLWGCMLGGTAPIPAYSRGKLVTRRGRLGPYRPAALAVGRTAYELCRLASHQTGSVYSNTDGVVSVDGSIPTIYEDVGMSLRVVSEGPTIVYSSASWQVGSRGSAYYNRGSTYQQGINREPLSTEPGLWGWLLDERAG